jgi:putative membrane protein (TIGR04086 family)
MQPGIGVYLASALLSNAPLMFLILALSFDPVLVSGQSDLLQVASFAIMFGGAGVSSYFVAKRFAQRREIHGIIVGCVSYAVYFAYSLFFYQGYALASGFWPLAAFILGGAVGARSSSILQTGSRRRLEPRKPFP